MDEPPAAVVRSLLRRIDRAALATVSARHGDGWPYASLVLVATDLDLTPLLLISRLADHTRNLLRDGRAALLFDGTGGRAEALSGPRATVLGRVHAAGDDEERLRARYLARHPEAELYAGFGDFALHALAPSEVHLVAGFGRVQWLPWADVTEPRGDLAALAAAEAGIVARLNGSDGPELAQRLLGSRDEAWRVVAVDPDGLDVCAGRERARLAFAGPATTPAAVWQALDRLRADAMPSS
jgi:putative heme iron utilization protein